MAGSPIRVWVALLGVALLAPASGLACSQPQAAPAAGKLTLSIDLTPAGDMLALFRRGSGTAGQIASIGATPAARALMAQTARTDSTATAGAFSSSLALAVAGRLAPDAPDPFAFNHVRQHAAQIERLYAMLVERGPALQRDIVARLQADLPSNLDLQVRAVFVLGGTSDGWAQPGNRLYLALQYFDGDYEGLVTLMTHEVYHVVQYRVMPATASAAGDLRQRNAENLMIATLMEGTASFVGDPTRATGGGPYLEWFRMKYRSNLERIQDDFALFDALMFRAARDGDAEYRELYNLGFSAAWGSPLYFVGYRMAQVIARYSGRARLAAYLAQPPGTFFADYMATCDMHRSDSLCVRFDAQTARTLLQVRDQSVGSGSRPRLLLL